MITFGAENGLKRKLSETLLKYRNLHNAICGVVVFFIYFVIGANIPIPGYDTMKLNSYVFGIILYTVIPSNILFIALGYYLPIFIKRMEKIQNIILVSNIVGLIYRLCVLLLFVEPKNSLELPMKLLMIFSHIGIISNTIEGMFGFALLHLFHKTSTVYKRLVIKRLN